MFKRSLAFLLCAVVCFGLFPPALTKAEIIGDFEVTDGVLVKYRGVGGYVVIPNGVTSIGDSAFAFCHGLTSIKIPNSVISIPWFGAFELTIFSHNMPRFPQYFLSCNLKRSCRKFFVLRQPLLFK